MILFRLTSPWVFTGMALAAVLAAQACSAPSDTRIRGFSSTSGGGAAATGGVSAANGGSAAAVASSGGAPLFAGGSFGSGGTSSSVDGGKECASTTQAAEEIVVEVPVEVTTQEPVALFIMIDRSGSMITGFPSPASPESWNNATAAVTAFVSDSTSAGIDVGLGTFPYGPNNTADCGGADCGQAVVPIAPLPGNAQAMIDGMQANAPSSGFALTPTECALNGMINHCIGFMQASPTGEQCVAILVTDGTPTQCDTNQGNLVTIVAQGAANGVKTYTLALPGADINFLNAMAQAGGTIAAFDVTAGPQAFIDSLNSIRSSVTTTVVHTEIQSTQLDCSWIVPNPPEGQTFDENKVNVEFQADGVPRQGFGKVPDAASCAQYQGGWYYDDSAVDGKLSISVCDDTCSIIKNTTGGRVDILLGCETIDSPLR